MNLSEAKKTLDKLKWTPGEAFKRRSPEDQKLIIEATTVFAKSRKVYEPKKAAKKAEGVKNA